MIHAVVSLVAGLLFGLGLVVSGMTSPHKVIGFLDFFGDWDMSLAFVMVGAIGVHAAAYRVLRGRTSPLLADRFHLPTAKDIDKKLIAGAAIFGIGWGLAGYCPGPAIASLMTLEAGVVAFVVSMAIGTLMYKQFVGREVR